MRIDLEVEPSDELQVFVNGKLAAELAVSRILSVQDLEAEVIRARRLEALPKIFKQLLRLSQSNDRKKAANALEGAIAGLRGETEPHPVAGVPEILPSYVPGYADGYEVGEAVKDISDALTSD